MYSHTWHVTLSTLQEIFSRRHIEIFCLFLTENRIWDSLQIVSTGDNLHEMSNPVFCEKISKIHISPICRPESGKDQEKISKIHVLPICRPESGKDQEKISKIHVSPICRPENGKDQEKISKIHVSPICRPESGKDQEKISKIHVSPICRPGSGKDQEKNKQNTCFTDLSPREW